MTASPVAGGGVDVLAVLDYEIRTIPISTEDFGPQRSQDVRDLVEARAAVAELIEAAKVTLDEPWEIERLRAALAKVASNGDTK